MTSSYLPQLLKQNVVGKGYGIVFLIVGECPVHDRSSSCYSTLTTFLIGVVNAIQIPLARLAVEELDGNFFIPNLVFTLMIIPCIIATWGLSRCIRKENETKQSLRESFQTGLLQAGGETL